MTNTQLKTQIDTDITNKTSTKSISPLNVGKNIKDVVDYTVQETITKELLVNKSINITTDAASDIKYPSVKAVKTYVDSKDLRPYKVYTALLTQSGTDAPVATILENTLGDIVWTRIAIGDYVGVLNSPVPVEKVHFTATSASEGYILSTFVNDTTHIEIIQKNTNPASYGSEDSMTLSPIEIRIYN